jgi:hypothetical protein
MKTRETPAPVGEVAADQKAVMESFVNGTPLDAEVARRVHDRAQRIREQILRKHGLVDIAVPAIRELRGDLAE